MFYYFKVEDLPIYNTQHIRAAWNWVTTNKMTWHKFRSSLLNDHVKQEELGHMKDQPELIIIFNNKQIIQV